MTQVQSLVAYRPALSILLTAIALFAAPLASARQTCEAAARKSIFGPVIFKIRDDGVDRIKLESFARIVNEINSNLKTIDFPERFTAFVGSFGRDSANYRMMTLTHFDFEAQERSELEVWMHEYGHVLFIENLVRRHPELFDARAINDIAKITLHQLRFYERGAESEKFQTAYRLSPIDPDKANSLLMDLLTTDQKLKYRFLNYNRQINQENDAPEERVIAMTRKYQEVIADLLPIVRRADAADRYGKYPFRRLIPQDISPVEMAAYLELDNPDEYDATFEARRHIAKHLAGLTDPKARWSYFERLLTLFLDDVSTRYRNDILSLPSKEESLRILDLVRSIANPALKSQLSNQ